MWKFWDLQPEIAGLDISDCAVKILKLKKKGKFYITEFVNEVDFEAGIVEAGVIKNENALAEIIKKSLIAQNGKRLNTKYVIVGLPEEKSFLEVIQMPEMKQSELVNAVKYQVENYIPLPVDRVYLDFDVIDNGGLQGDHTDILITAMAKEVIDLYMSCIKKTGLIPVIMEVESQAIARALIKNETSNESLILVNYGKKNSNIIIFQGRSIRFTSSVTASCDQITQAIAKELNISMQEAEKIKINYSLEQKDKDDESSKIYRAIYPALQDLVLQIRKYLEFYKDHAVHNHDKNTSAGERIIITGGGSNMKGLSNFLSKEIGIKAEIGNVFVNAQLKNNIFKDGKSQSFCTAIGLALRGASKKIEI